MYLKFESVSRPVLLTQGLKVLPHLARVLARWPVREVPADRFGDPAISVLQDGDDAVIQAPWIESEQRFGSAVDLADNLARHLARSWIQENAPAVGITAAAARFGDGLAVLVGGPQSGKSLLISCLSVSGHAVFADSILPVSGTGSDCVSLGIAPRLKLPLPESFSGPLRTRVEHCLDQCAPHLGYLMADKANIAAFGERANVRAFVILDRTAGNTTSLRPAAASTLLKRLLLGSVDSLPSPRAVLDLLHDVATDIPCYRLTWSDPAEAASKLRAHFALRPPLEVDDPLRAVVRKAPPRRRASGPRMPSGQRFRHVDGLHERMVDGDMFLVDPDGEAIYHLNSLGTGLWRLLDGSHGLDDVISVLQNAFPTVDRSLIAGDVARLVTDLAERGLLVEQPAGICVAHPAPPIP